MTKYLEVNNLSYSYPDGHEALKNISFDLDNKESLAILGPNGAGKTTLILHLNGILGNLDKQIKVSNFEYTDENIADIRKTVGVVFQDPDDQLFMPTVIEDVMFGPKNFGFTDEESERLALDALDKVNMSDYLDRPPHHLSYGQKRKVAIASVLASKPKLLVLDEPGSNLDPSSRRELIDILNNLDVSKILVTHDLPMALEICKRSIVLNEGEVTRDDQTINILNDENFMKENRLELPFGFAFHHFGEE